jgi:hypothetical protein
MGDLVNLRRARKSRVRADALSQADANRVAFGRTKAEKSLTKAERDLAERRIDGHRMEPARDERD